MHDHLNKTKLYAEKAHNAHEKAVHTTGRDHDAALFDEQKAYADLEKVLVELS